MHLHSVTNRESTVFIVSRDSLAVSAVLLVVLGCESDSHEKVQEPYLPSAGRSKKLQQFHKCLNLGTATGPLDCQINGKVKFFL